MKMHAAKKLSSISAVAILLLGLAVPGAIASGADGGDFDCKLTGVPGWGHVTATYNHPSRRHYATAIGTGTKTVHANAGHTAEAVTGRSARNNKCLYGFG